jgi:hypothetical protein
VKAQWSGDCVCLWIAGLADLGVVAQERSCWPAQVSGAQPAVDRDCLWITGLASLRGVTQESRDCACLWIAGLAGPRVAAW